MHHNPKKNNSVTNEKLTKIKIDIFAKIINNLSKVSKKIIILNRSNVTIRYEFITNYSKRYL